MATSSTKPESLQDKNRRKRGVAQQQSGTSLQQRVVDGNLQNKKRRNQMLDEEQWTPARYEVDYYQQESDLHDRWKKCKKNPDHSEFIPISQFNLQHLPEGYRDNLWWDYIQTVIFLTVRLTVKYTSKCRPDDDKIAFVGDIDLRSKCWPRVGTGMVCGVYRKFTEKDGRTCPCTECQKSPHKAKRQWGEFGVLTAAHVVYDDEECRKTRCDVWFDDDGDKDKYPKLEGVGVVYSNIETDTCLMMCITHDENVYKMEKMFRRYYDLRNKLHDRYSKSPAVKDMREVPVVVISHPHGMSKHVTVGVVSGAEQHYPFKLSYTTETCPGSSGAPVIALSKLDSLVWPDVLLSRATHSGCKRKGENQSGCEGYLL